MQLGELLRAAGYGHALGDRHHQEIGNLATDSRTCAAGDLFLGMAGSRADGSLFARQALARGAVVAVVSEASGLAGEGILVVPDVAIACAELAAAFYGFPAQKLTLVGVTGTNGKTTTTHLLEYLLQPSRPTALLGTLYARWPGYSQEATHTTPFATTLQAQLSHAVRDGVRTAVMEVSSHALAQKRVWGCPFEVAVFTNLTQDHLDYHRDMEDYFQAKALLFGADYLRGRAIVNLDDPSGARLAEAIASAPVWTYSLANPAADILLSDIAYNPNGMTARLRSPLGEATLTSALVGSFNAANIAAAVGAALHLGVDLAEIAARLPGFTSVPGRVERVWARPDQDIAVVVDYAHTPDSLENVLAAMRPFTQRELICVFGCGGDRDRTKRPLMGSIAARLADRVYVTSDNPRTEDPQRILQDILAGIPEATQPIVEVDRRTSIHRAIAEAKPGDTVVIAGKGHEDYQILGTTKIHFDDREEARAALAQRF